MKIILSLLLIIISNITLSESVINISAETILLNNDTGIGIYTGGVVIKKDEAKLTANKIIIKRENKKIQTIKISASKEKPIFYYNDINSNTPTITALMIDYNAKNNTLILSGMVQIIDNNNKILADNLIYNIDNKSATITANKNGKVQNQVIVNDNK